MQSSTEFKRLAMMFCLIASLPLGLGCQLNKASSCMDCQSPEPTVRQALVTVGGMVSQPGTIQLGSGVATLTDAVSAAGGVIHPTVLASQSAYDSPLENLLENISLITTETASVGKEVVENQGASPDPAAKSIERLKVLHGDMEDARRKIEDYVSVHFNNQPSFLNELFKKIRVLQDLTASLQGIEVQEGISQTVGVVDLQNASRELQQELRRARSQFPSSVPQTTSNLPDAGSGLDKRLLVQLKRPADGKVVNYYFPLTYVEAGDAGNIPLNDGDVIFVKSHTQTVLGSAPSTSGNAIALTGFVRQEAIYPQGGIATLGGVQTVIHPRVNPAKVVLIVERATGSGKDIFVLPYQAVTDRDAFSSVSTHPNDHIRVVPSFQAPLISDMAANRLAGRELATQVDSIVANRPVLNHEEEKHIRMQKALRSAGTKMSRLIRP